MTRPFIDCKTLDFMMDAFHKQGISAQMTEKDLKFVKSINSDVEYQLGLRKLSEKQQEWLWDIWERYDVQWID